jgi:hypothetical protein
MPHIDGKTLIGWGVVREFPWDFAGLFASQDDAQAKADALGEGYIVRYGERHEESNSFVFSATTCTTTDDRASRLTAVAAAIDARIEKLLY